MAQCNLWDGGTFLGIRWKALKVSVDLAKSEGIPFMFILKACTWYPDISGNHENTIWFCCLKLPRVLI